MSDVEVPDRGTRTIAARWASVLASLLAAGLLLGSAALQQMASMQRWVVFRSQLSEPISAEDHLYDYSYPWDPWVPIGTAAQLFGTGTLLAALGVLAVPLGVSVLTRTAPRRAVVIVGETGLVILVAGGFGIHGAHALLSGLAGSPSPLQHTWVLGLIAALGLGILARMWSASGIAMTACVFLIGSTALGGMLAASLIAPLIANGGSHDTTPWTESVVAASTAAAGLAMIFAAGAAVRGKAPAVAEPLVLASAPPPVGSGEGRAFTAE